MEPSLVGGIHHPDDEDLYGSRLKALQRLIRFKIRDILLVSSLYDSYLFEEDGQLHELIRREFQALDLSHLPEVTNLTSGREALDLLRSGEHFDLVITTIHVEDMRVVRLAAAIRQISPQTPIVLLAYDNQERKELMQAADVSVFNQVFIWKGDYRLLVAIIKSIEDRANVAEDTTAVGVQSIILVEDNVNFASLYLPLIYTEVFNQSRRLIAEGVNLTHRYLRQRARPKILFCSSYEEAWRFYEQYENYILAIISDIDILRDGGRDPEGGIHFAVRVRSRHADIPILLQSSNPAFAGRAKEIDADFLVKTSPRLLHELRQFMLERFGFGDFVFRMPTGEEVGRARDLSGLAEQLRIVPGESILFHARQNHFSNWLKARTEFSLAYHLRPRRPEDFASVEDLRGDLLSALNTYREARKRGVVSEFQRDSFDVKNSFARVGTGSMGGKARGLGFLNLLMSQSGVAGRFEDVRIEVPSAIVVATDAFDRFLAQNSLESFAMSCTDDHALQKKFLCAEYFPHDILEQLRMFLEIVHVPLAVRSSSLLEDSQYQPFAGVYDTFMIPNNHPDPAVRLRELLDSIKLVYASTFATKAKAYMAATSYRLEEEKMAVIIQRMVGSAHGETFYPEFAGVAKSYNFYPIPPQKSDDGIVMVALGLGKTVVEGGNTVRFCPKYPRHLLQFFSTLETIQNAQQNFAALDLNGSFALQGNDDPATFVKTYDLEKAERDQTLLFVGSTYSRENDSVYDGIARSGRRVVTFAPILKHKIFPLPEIMEAVLDLGHWGMGTHVEIEFAANLSTAPGEKKEFSLLQIRPLVLSLEMEELDVESVPAASLLVRSEQVLGNGVITGLRDLVVVDIQTFDRGKSEVVANEVAEFNESLVKAGRPYILIGVGRWGSLDRWLGIPVTYGQISGARVIVESGFKDLAVTPSQGSHFFQNITSFRIGYFTVSESPPLGCIDWEWMRGCRTAEEGHYTRHLQFQRPLTVKINGYRNKGVILKPEP
ncbi:MAG TPA: PEP/pyruvate-binding domain-containing protein [Bacteroidota bacterium]|nr:PEP/pyruvate-binding domain-containing protein [Bacteroidota bacterium]